MEVGGGRWEVCGVLCGVLNQGELVRYGSESYGLVGSFCSKPSKKGRAGGMCLVVSGRVFDC